MGWEAVLVQDMGAWAGREVTVNWLENASAMHCPGKRK